MIFRFSLSIACASLALMGSAHSREPVLSWDIQRVDATGAVLPREFHQSSFDGANLQARTLCDKAMAARAGWPETSSVLVTVRPINAAPEDPRKKVVTVPCVDYERNPRALEAYISRPQAKPTPEKKLIQLWD
jgi:hypothetical protein